MSNKRMNLEDIISLLDLDQRIIVLIGKQETCGVADCKVIADMKLHDLLPTDTYHTYKNNRVICIRPVPKKGLGIYVQENYESQPNRRVLKMWSDIVTVPEELKNFAKNYESLGYEVDLMFSNSFRIRLDDGIVYVYWQDGVFWEEIRENGQE